MKYLKKFLESKDPIDVDSDIEEFRSLFSKRINEFAEGQLKKLSDGYGNTMTDDYKYYKVYSVDDYGREEYVIMIVRAVSKFHAQLKVAIKNKRADIALTGFYSAKQVDIEIEISNLEKMIASSQARLEELKRIS